MEWFTGGADLKPSASIAADEPFQESWTTKAFLETHPCLEIFHLELEQALAT